jgi:hypothetical protein
MTVEFRAGVCAMTGAIAAVAIKEAASEAMSLCVFLFMFFLVCMISP